MITAKELFNKMLEENDEFTSTEMMIEFAKLHVEEALKQASEKALIKRIMYKDDTINKDSILNAYSLDGIV